MKEFTKAVEANMITDAGRWLEFMVNGPGEDDHVLCRALAEPTGGQVAYFMSKNLSHVPAPEKLGAMLNFFDSALDDESQAHITKRLLDPEDPYDLEDIQEVMMWLMEEWSGRPTRSLHGSTPSQQGPGPSSTPTTPEQTYSDSPFIVSATSSTPGSTNGQLPPIY